MCECVCVAEPQSHPPMKDPLFKVCDFTMITAAVISCEVFNDRKLHFNDCSNSRSRKTDANNLSLFMPLKRVSFYIDMAIVTSTCEAAFPFSLYMLFKKWFRFQPHAVLFAYKDLVPLFTHPLFVHCLQWNISR